MGSQHWTSSVTRYITFQTQVNMIEINRKKLKAAFILHLFSATFVLLAFQNFGFLFINITAIIFEIVFLSVFWPTVSTSLTIFCSVMAVINLVGRFISSTVLVLDTRKLMRADPKYKVEKKQKDKEVAVVE